MTRAQAVPALEEARQTFRRAHFDDAAALLRARLAQPGDNADSAFLLARVELRRGNPSEALAVLTRFARSSKRLPKAEAALLKGVAFARLGDAASSRAQFRAAESLLQPGEELNAELLYQQAASAWMDRKLDRAEKLLDRIPAQRDGDLDLHASILRGAIASANEDLAGQGAILLAALRRIRPHEEPDTYLYGMLVTHVASLAEELPSADLRDAAIAHAANVRWTREIGDLHFHTARAIAWRHALEGDEFSAFRRLKEALSAASTDAWRVAALTDRAYLAAALGEPRWAAQELRDAHELAATIDWNAIAGEEKLALPVLAELFAKRDPAVAIGYVSMFSNVGKTYPRVLSSRRDRRVEALEVYSLGKVQLALGDRKEAQRLLAQAWNIYDAMRMPWRAARAALALAKIDDAQPWRERARTALGAYPRSWLARGTGVLDAPAGAAPRNAVTLTAAQQTVLDLLLQGRGTDEIAGHLGRSAFTVRNHIKAIFKAYGVTSRSALIVRASRG